MKYPVTPSEWQEAVDLSEFYLILDSAVKYGLITGGPVINQERCVALLKRGLIKGYTPAAPSKLIDRYLHTGAAMPRADLR